MSSFRLKAIIPALFMATSAAATQPPAEQALAPDMAMSYVDICTGNKMTYDSVIAPALEVSQTDAQKLLAAYKDENATYAARLEQGGYNPAPCRNFN